MPWKERNGSIYLYVSKRRGKRVVSEYYGRGFFAQSWHVIEASEKEAKRLERKKRDKERKWYASRDAELAAQANEAIVSARRFLEALGFHQHKWQWRKRRGLIVDGTQLVEIAKPLAVTDYLKVFNLGRPDVIALAKLTYAGVAYRDEPDKRKKKHDRMKEHLACDLRGHVVELVGPSPTGVERQLAITAGLIWIELRFTEYDAWYRRFEAESYTLSSDEFRQRRLDRLRRRYSQILKTIADVRRLSAPLIGQLNVQNNQGPGVQQNANTPPETR
jgi:hypothetical protein